MSDFPETRDPNEKRKRIGTAYHCPDTDQYILMMDDDPQIEIARQTARAEAAEAKADRYEDALQKIGNWAKAYPLDIFPEPDFKKVHEVLKAAGITLDSVSASNMRHVISGVEQIVSEALKGGEE